MEDGVQKGLVLAQLCACLSSCFFSLLECSGLPSDPNAMQLLALPIIKEPALINQPVETAIWPYNAIFNLVWRFRAIVLGEKRENSLSILWMDQRAIVGKVFPGIRGKTQEDFAFGAPDMLIAHSIPIIHTNSCCCHRHLGAILVKGDTTCRAGAVKRPARSVSCCQ